MCVCVCEGGGDVCSLDREDGLLLGENCSKCSFDLYHKTCYC